MRYTADNLRVDELYFVRVNHGKDAHSISLNIASYREKLRFWVEAFSDDVIIDVSRAVVGVLAPPAFPGSLRRSRQFDHDQSSLQVGCCIVAMHTLFQARMADRGFDVSFDSAPAGSELPERIAPARHAGVRHCSPNC